MFVNRNHPYHFFLFFVHYIYKILTSKEKEKLRQTPMTTKKARERELSA